ncbi:MAG: hypothetical protein ABJF07_14270 [Nisaea sp.]|uniref:hypothetical protein n=1 Tax=Nisaea sp. TaxID=2024842 RepID=UPI003266B338
MADAFFARTTQSCKENSTNTDDIVTGARLPTDSPVQGGLPPAAFGPTRPRALVIGGSMYIAGLAPAVPIASIPDLPDDLRDRFRAAAERCIASSEGSRKDAATHNNDADLPGSAFPDSTAGKPETEKANESYTAGPVFCRAEVTAARKLLERLEKRRFILVRPEGLRMAAGVTVRPEVCRKLSAIGMIDVTEWRGGVVVRRAPDSDLTGPRG